MAAPAAQRGGGRSLLEIVLALAASLAAFAVTAILGTAARSHVPEELFGALILVGVVVLARRPGILFALPVGVAAVLAFDWYYLPPLRALDANTVLVLGTFLLMSVIVGTSATHASRRAISAERARGALAAEQGALRRVATLVAQQGTPAEVFRAVAEETGHLLQVDVAQLFAYETGQTARLVGSWSRVQPPVRPPGSQLRLEGDSVVARVFRTEQPARIDDYSNAEGPTADYVRSLGIRAAVAAPVLVEGRMWGAMTAGSMRPEPLGGGAEGRIAAFAELVATAIANAQARLELRGHAEEQAALRRVAILVARAAPPEAVFAAVTEEAGRVLSADITILSRCESEDVQVSVGGWSATGGAVPFPAGTRVPLGGRNVVSLVVQTGQPARIADAGGPVADAARGWGLRSAVGAPIRAGGRLWGVITVAAGQEQPLPADTEDRLAGFADLVGTAIANAEAQAELAASRTRIVTAADDTRHRIERDLHDGAQQQLVALALRLRTTVQAAVPPGAGELVAQLDGIAAELGDVLDELRELARGLHPAALADGGLRPALKALARRSAVPVRLDVRIDERLPEPIELAAYYVVAEALTNTAKHAGASVVDVDVEAGEGVLRLGIRDDGRGGADPTGGSGLVGLTDRIEALGGRLALHSPPGAGTAVAIELPTTASSRSGSPAAATLRTG